MNDNEARSFHSEQRKFVPAARSGKTVESHEDYLLHYDQLEACLDHMSKSRRVIPGLIVTPKMEAEFRARQSQTIMWKRESTHPLAQSLVYFERRIEAGRLRAKRNASPVPTELLEGYQREYEQRESEKRHRLNTSEGAALR